MHNDEEILNLHYHIQRLCVMALNKNPMIHDAANALGISERTLYRYRDQYNIVRDKKTGKYFIQETNHLKVA